ncbi:MAG: choice-of-anchor J domain-containing protein [Muribaculaceae bacterium]|nr:choice-of-anchor J domain-containing protein [Muribaculaceae bacterium]
MKKTSTLALSVLLAAGAWCGLAYAAEGDAPAAEQKTTTFDFTGDVEGLTATNDSKAEYVTTFSLTQDDVKFEFDANGGSGLRLWKTNSGNQLRVYNKSQLTFSIGEGGDIQEIAFTANDGLDKISVAGDAFTKAADATKKAATFTGSGESVTFNASGTAQITSVVVKYIPGAPEVPDTRKEAVITTNAQPEYTVVMGSNWYGPYFSVEPYTLGIKYTSSNEEVVTVSEWGQPTIVGPGEAIITATTGENEEYKSVSVSYKITVLPEGTVLSSKDGKEFAVAAPWSYDETYGYIKATGFVGGANTATKGMAVSPEINLDKNSAATLTFDYAINYLKGAKAADFCKVYVAVIESENNSEPELYDGEEAEEETPAELNWVAVADEIATPEKDSWTWYPQTINLGTEYAGKTVKIGFEYTSTEETACTWEVKNISVVCTDLLKPLKDAAYAEVCKYGEFLGDYLNPWMLNGWQQTINSCESEDEINEAVEYILSQITSTIYSKMEMNFTWTVAEGKVATYVADAAEGTSPWQAAEFQINSLFTCERVKEPGMTPWNADAKASADDASDDAFYIKNSKSGLYVAAPTTVGTPVGATDDIEQAGIFVLKCTQDVITMADDATGLFITFDATKGMILSEKAEMVQVDELNTWEKEANYSVSAEFPGAETQGWQQVVDEISVIKIAVSTEAVLSGIGGITLETFDRFWNRVILLNLPAESLAAITPEPGQGFNTEWVAGEEVQVPFEANVYTIALREKITDGGDYSLTVAEGTFVVNTEDGKLFSPEAYASVTIPQNENEEGFAPLVTPATGEVEQLDKICIEPLESFEGILSVNWSSAIDAKIILASAESIIAEWDKNQIDAANVRDIDDFSAPDKYELNLESPVVENGDYVLTIEEEVFEDNSGNLNGMTQVFYTVKNENVKITDITVNGKSVIYDLQGRRINGNARGIVIANGKKILVK